MNLRTKVTLAMTGAILACLVVFGLFTIDRSREALLTSEIATLSAMADARASELETLVAGYRQNAALVASRTRLRELLADHSRQPDPATAASMTQIVVDAAGGEQVVQHISVIDAAGTIVATTDETLLGVRAVEAPETFGALPEPGAPSEVQAVIGPSSVGFVVFAPMELGGEVIGTVQVEVAPTAVNLAVQAGGFRETGEITVGMRDAGGDVRLLVPGPQGPGAAAPEAATSGGAADLMARALGGDSVVAGDVVDGDGVHVIAVTRHLQPLGWGLVATIDRAEALAGVSSVRNALLALGGVLSLLGLVAGRALGQRFEAELASRGRAETLFDTLFASAPAAMMLVAADGRIRLANQRSEELLGYQRDQLRGLSVEALVPEQYRSRHQELRHELASGREARELGHRRHLVAVARSGRQVPVEIGLTPVETGEGPMVLAALIDLSEQLRTERALEERATALARSNRDLDAFAYVASHDLKAPLRAIEQLTGFALEDAGDALPEKSRQDLQLVQQRSRRLMGMLDGLLDYARIGRDEGAASLIDLGAVLAELAELYVPAERFSLEIPDDLPPIQAPRAAVELVFRNLLMNVVKHHDQDRGHIRIGWRAGDGYLHLTVADDGPGVPSTHREKVFELFQTLGRHDEVVASGMGLALVKRTVETHGGTVTLCAGEGRGATFEVAWPQRRSGETVAWEELASGNVLLG